MTVYIIGRLVCGIFGGIGVGVLTWVLTGAAKGEDSE